MNLYNLLLKDKTQAWIETATVVLAIFSVLLWDVDDRIEHDTVLTQRAFVFVKDISQVRVVTKDILTSVNFMFSIENSGATAPRQLLMHSSHRYDPNPLAEDYDFPDLWDLGQPHVNPPHRGRT
jgi:hypothetical protein